ncbi:MAG: cytochrome c oxidase subunit II [Pseudoxanthomonas suwonensis]|nr:cytochrome c oxidase subunit II [Pseudoxanthomonas suwonensis]
MMPRVAVTGALALAGCSAGAPLSALHPAASGSQAIATLWWGLLAGAGVVMLVVGILLVMGYRRAPTPSAAPSHGDAEGRVWTQGWGLGFGVPVVLAALVAGMVLGERLLPRGEAAATIEAVASQWRWRFAVADAPGTATDGTMHIPAGVPVDVRIRSEDVIHGLWIPRLAGKLDAIPGYVNTLRLDAVEAGEYEAICAEYCGVGHRGHRFRVVAHEPEHWRRWLAGERR